MLGGGDDRVNSRHNSASVADGALRMGAGARHLDAAAACRKPSAVTPPYVPDPKFPKPPDKPTEDECCHRGCCPCIFDYYYDALERWEARVLEKGGDPKAILKAMGRD